MGDVVMPESLHIANLNAIPPVGGTDNDGFEPVCNYGNMLKRKKTVELPPENFLMEWREFRRMTQEQLADAVGTDKSVISLLENSQRKLSHKWAQRLSVPLNVRPGWLLDLRPEDIDSDILQIWGEIPDRDKPQARVILETFRKKG